MYYGKTVTGDLCVEVGSTLFKDVFRTLMVAMRERCRTASDSIDAAIWEGERIVCFIRCYSDSYRVVYVGYKPIYTRFE